MRCGADGNPGKAKLNHYKVREARVHDFSLLRSLSTCEHNTNGSYAVGDSDRITHFALKISWKFPITKMSAMDTVPAPCRVTSPPSILGFGGRFFREISGRGSTNHANPKAISGVLLLLLVTFMGTERRIARVASPPIATSFPGGLRSARAGQGQCEKAHLLSSFMGGGRSCRTDECDSLCNPSPDSCRFRDHRLHLRQSVRSP